MSQPVTTTSSDEQVVIFQISHESYAVPISCVHEIIREQHITSVPGVPVYIEGIINLRGRVIPVLDLHKRLQLPVEAQTRSTRIVVIEIGGQILGFIVDEVSEVLQIAPKSIEPPSPLITNLESHYLTGIAKVDDRLILLLDLDHLLSPKEQQQLEESNFQAECTASPR
jgi:purine-binding chemotaxis protein CheW